MAGVRDGVCEEGGKWLAHGQRKEKKTSYRETKVGQLCELLGRCRHGWKTKGPEEEEQQGCVISV